MYRYMHGLRHNPPLDQINERTVLDAVLAAMPPAAADMLVDTLGRPAMEQAVREALIARLREKVRDIVANG